jgi:hypothetical protein
VALEQKFGPEKSLTSGRMCRQLRGEASMKSHLRLLDHISHEVLPIAVLVSLVGTTDMAVAQQTQIVIDDTRVFPESLTSTLDATIIVGRRHREHALGVTMTAMHGWLGVPGCFLNPSPHLPA